MCTGHVWELDIDLSEMTRTVTNPSALTSLLLRRAPAEAPAQPKLVLLRYMRVRAVCILSLACYY